MPNTYEAIATNTLSSTTATVTFSSISGAYTDLVLTTNCRIANGDNAFHIRFNSDSGANYTVTLINSSGSTATSARGTSENQSLIGVGGTSVQSSVVHINNYSNATTYKPFFVQIANSTNYNRLVVGSWLNTNAITSVTILLLGAGDTFSIGSSFTLYGIKGA
jgi:hypothetical protein